MAKPEALAVDQSNGDIYVLEHDSGCVSRFYGRGAEAYEPKEFPATSSNKLCGISFREDASSAQIAIDNSGTSTEGTIYVNSFVDPNSETGIQEYDNEGNLEENIPPRNRGDGLVYQCGVFTDPEGNVYVAEHYAGFYKYKHDDPVTDADFEGGPYVGPICDIAIDPFGDRYFAFPSNGPLIKSVPDLPYGFVLNEVSWALAMDPSSNDIYVSEGGEVVGISREGIQFDHFGAGHITESRGVAIDEKTGTAYVADTANGRIAIFEGLPAYRLAIEPEGTGYGSVSADKPPVSNCGDEGQCTGFYPASSTVVLTATPQPHSVVGGWTGCDSVSVEGDECTVNLTSDREVSAIFTRIEQPLTVNLAGTGTGSVSTPNHLGLIQECGDGGECTGPYDEGSVVTLLPTSTGHSSFTGWSGACTNSSGPCEVVMEGPETVTAHFTAQHAVSVAKAGTGAGSVVSEPEGVSCGGACTVYFTDGETITLSAIAAAHSSFAGWSGEGCSGTSTCQVLAGTSTKKVTATFLHDPPVAVTESGATFVGQHAGTVGGNVNPEGAEVTRCVFEYGTSTSYGSETPCAPSAVGSGTDAVEIGANLTNLSPGTTYHYRLSATSAGGTAHGGDQTFSTLADTCDSNAALCPPPPQPPVETVPCRKGFVLRKGRCMKRRHHRTKRRHHTRSQGAGK